MSESQQPVFTIEKIYVKDLSVEVPNAPAIFLEREAPGVDVQMNTQGGPIAEDIYQVLLTVTVSAKVGERTMFLVEATQGGIFRIAGVPQEQVELVLGITCPNLLFPYVRETISDAVGRAGFMPLYLNPVNFEAIYAQRMQAAQAAAAQAGGAPN
ncbi:MAG: protein-export chaperone SecB [Burkholderiales bacterium]